MQTYYADLSQWERKAIGKYCRYKICDRLIALCLNTFGKKNVLHLQNTSTKNPYQ